MGQHKYNPSAVLAKAGLLGPGGQVQIRPEDTVPQLCANCQCDVFIRTHKLAKLSSLHPIVSMNPTAVPLLEFPGPFVCFKCGLPYGAMPPVVDSAEEEEKNDEGY